MMVYPLELGSFIEFKRSDSDDFTGEGFRQIDILEINPKTIIQEGFFRKKEDILLEIIFNLPSGTKKILLNVEDKHASEIMDTINTNKNFEQNDYLKLPGDTL